MAKTKRSFSSHDIPEKSEDYHGGCRVFRVVPDIASKGVKSVNIVLTFEECLRLSTALQSGILKLNRYNRLARAGREMGLFLSFKTGNNAITVGETKLKPAAKRARGANPAADGEKTPGLG